MSRSGLVGPKHRVDSVLPGSGGQAEHGPGRAALQMGCRIIRLPNARTSGTFCVSSRRGVVAGRLPHTTCRTRTRLTGGEGRWRRLHTPQANAGPEFDGCLEVMDQASVFLISRRLRRPEGANGASPRPSRASLGPVPRRGPCRLVWAETASSMYPCIQVPTYRHVWPSPAARHRDMFFLPCYMPTFYLSDPYTDNQNSPQAGTRVAARR